MFLILQLDYLIASPPHTSFLSKKTGCPFLPVASTGQVPERAGPAPYPVPGYQGNRRLTSLRVLRLEPWDQP